MYMYESKSSVLDKLLDKLDLRSQDHHTTVICINELDQCSTSFDLLKCVVPLNFTNVIFNETKFSFSPRYPELGSCHPQGCH